MPNYPLNLPTGSNYLLNLPTGSNYQPYPGIYRQPYKPYQPSQQYPKNPKYPNFQKYPNFPKYPNPINIKPTWYTPGVQGKNSIYHISDRKSSEYQFKKKYTFVD